jgi:hypothetical protein
MHVRNASLIGKCGCDQSSKDGSAQNSSHKSPLGLTVDRISHDVANWIKLSRLLGAKRTTMRGGESTRTPNDSDPKLSTLNKWYCALEGAGIEFIDDDAERGPGVRRRSGKPAGKRK